MKTIILALAALIIGSAAAWALWPPPPAPEAPFVTLAGERFATSSLRGKVVLVSFWATYCGPCVKEMPQVVATHLRYAPRGYDTVAVAVSKDNRARVAAFARAHALPFTVAFDDGAAAQGFGNVRLTPTAFLIDRRGRVLKRVVGPIDWVEMRALIEAALARPGQV